MQQRQRLRRRPRPPLTLSHVRWPVSKKHSNCAHDGSTSSSSRGRERSTRRRSSINKSNFRISYRKLQARCLPVVPHPSPLRQRLQLRHLIQGARARIRDVGERLAKKHGRKKKLILFLLSF